MTRTSEAKEEQADSVQPDAIGRNTGLCQNVPGYAEEATRRP